MRYLILLADGAADLPLEALGGKTPLEAAHMPHADRLAALGIVGLVRTVPPGMAPGSDAANLSVMGYDPARYHTGRSPLEAASMGIDLAPEDVAIRCNLVTLEGEGPYETRFMADHSAGDITTGEAAELIHSVGAALGTERIQFFPGVSYRHALIIRDGSTDYELTPPHDILDRCIGDYLPKGRDAALLEELMRRSVGILAEHPVNASRRRRGERTADSIWVWGQGRKPALPSFREKYGVRGATISAVDLIKGIGVCAGLEAREVPGATGTIHTNFEGKADAAIDLFRTGTDFVYLHLEAPDECAHQGDREGKIRSLELIDAKVLGPVAGWLAESGDDYRILLLPDHPTPLSIRTHSRDPVPFVLYDSRSPRPADPARRFTERTGAAGPYVPDGWRLTDAFFGKNNDLTDG